MKRILIITNSIYGLHKFRKELVEKLLCEGYKIYLSGPKDDKTSMFNSDKLTILYSRVDRRGLTPITDLKLLLNYRKILKNIQPDLVLTYTIKPNIYGGIISRLYNTPYISNITGLGTALENKGILKFFLTRLYKVALKKAKVVYFQNLGNMNFMFDHKIKGEKNVLISGSGVNLKEYKYIEYPIINTTHFLFVGRIMKDKGIDLYLESARIMKNKYKNIDFHVVGMYEEDYKTIIEEYDRRKYIKYHGLVNNVKDYYTMAHAIVHPSFHEGMSNVLLEAAASGRPIIASNIYGCKELFDDGVSGFGFEVKNQRSLNETLEKFIDLSYDEKKQMGINGRNKIMREFDRDMVVDNYLRTIKSIMEDKQ